MKNENDQDVAGEQLLKLKTRVNLQIPNNYFLRLHKIVVVVTIKIVVVVTANIVVFIRPNYCGL